MPNGDDKNWIRVCAAIDGFRATFGRWPKRIRVDPIIFEDLVSHLLTPIGYALVSSFVGIVREDEATVIAEDGTGAEYNYGRQGFPKRELEPPAREWFGQAVLRAGVE